MNSYMFRIVLLMAALTCGAAASGVSAAESPGSLLDQAERSLQQGQARTAEIQAKNVLQRDPQNASALVVLARAYIDMDQLALALRQLEQARLMGADEAKVRALIAHVYLQQQDYKRVLREINSDGSLSAQGRATILALRGVAELNLGHEKEAKEAFDAAFELDPDSVDAHLGYARLAIRDRELDSAASHLGKAKSAAPDYVETLLVEGELARVKNDFATARESFQRVLQRRPKNTLAHLGLAAVLLDQGDLAKAQEHLTVVLRDWPNHPVANYLRGELAYRAGNKDEAKSALRLALAIMPGHLPSHMLLGGIEFSEGRPESAAKHLERYIAARPDQLPARKLLAASYLKLDQPKKALDALEPALGGSVTDAQIQALAGSTYMRMGEPNKAAEHFQRAVQLDPSAAGTRMELFVSLLLSDTPGQAGQELHQTIELGTSPEQVLVMRTQLLLTKKSYDDALKAAKELQRQAPKNPAGYNLAGVAYLGKSQPEQAQQEFRQALKVAPEFTLAAMNLAAMALQASDLTRARDYFQKVLNINPEHVGALQGLAEIAHREGNTEVMLENLERARRASASALEPRMRLYEYHLQRGDMKVALDLAQEMAASHPANPDVLRALGIAQQGEHLIKRALESFKKLIELQPESAEAHALYADALASYGDLDTARKELEESLRLEPDSIRARVGLGALEARAGNADRALQIAAEIQRRHPDRPAGFELEGDLRLASRAARQAAELYAKAYERAPSDRLAQKRFHALRQARQPEDSYAALQEWLHANPQDVETRILLAKAYQIDGKDGEAEQTYRAVLQRDPNRADVMNNLAWITLQRDPGKALQWAEKAYQLSPQNPAIIDTYGWAVFQRGDRETGLGLLQEALLKAPQDSGIRFHVAQALEQVGNYDEAHRHVKQILYTDPQFSQKAQAEAMLKRLERR